MGDLQLEPALSGEGVRREGEELVFDGEGSATLGPHTLLDFHDGDFSFVTRINAAPAGAGTIAAREGSWRLWLEDGRVVLELRDSEGRSLRLETPELERGRSHQVGFTVFAWKRSPSTVRLYLDGRVAAESLEALHGVHSSDAPISLGNTADLRAPFRGRIDIPRISVLCLQPADLLADYENRKQADPGRPTRSQPPASEARPRKAASATSGWGPA